MLLRLSVFVVFVVADCLMLNITDLSICYPYVASYIETVYVNQNPVTQVPFATILQQFCETLLEFNYRPYYWAIACGLGVSFSRF
jgi:hypothetical protein